MGLSTKYLVFLGVFIMLLFPVYASEFDYNKYRGNTELQNDLASNMNAQQAKIQPNSKPPPFETAGQATLK